jgi:galactokinase/mevalonate kinase-like predicted kinase
MVLTGAAGLNRMRVARIANSIESSLTVCGYQDHLSSAFGGANLWSWGVRDTQTLGGVRRIPLLAAGAVAALNRRLGVVFTGEAHDSSVTTQDWIRQYCAGTNRDEWYAANDATADLAAALADQDWTAARTALDRESRLREQCSPGAVTPAAHGFLDIARDLGCAARFAGGGGGGSVWAFGDPEDIASVVASWRNHGRCVPGSTHLSCAPTARGVHVWTT